MQRDLDAIIGIEHYGSTISDPAAVNHGNEVRFLGVLVVRSGIRTEIISPDSGITTRKFTLYANTVVENDHAPTMDIGTKSNGDLTFSETRFGFGGISGTVGLNLNKKTSVATKLEGRVDDLLVGIEFSHSNTLQDTTATSYGGVYLDGRVAGLLVFGALLIVTATNVEEGFAIIRAAF